jgi:putative ABC transport system permease protein
MDGFRPLQVVGVVRDVRFRNLLRAPDKTVYLAFSQDYLPWSTLHIRSAQPPAALIKPVLDVVKNLDSSVPLAELQPLAYQLDRSLWQQRFSATLMTVFGLLALGLAALGIYGVISYSVTQRTRELGVRMALGARPQDVLRLILRQAATLTLIGAAAGLAGSLALGRLIASQLYGVTASDPLTLAAVILLLSSVAVLAAYLPARRATQVDPMVALRSE